MSRPFYWEHLTPIAQLSNFAQVFATMKGKWKEALWNSADKCGFRNSLQALVIGTLVPLFSSQQLTAAEGGYSNYIPGTYGDFGMALAPTETWTLRNDIYYYSADGDKSLRSGILEVDADLDFPMNFTTVLYKPDLKILGGQYATGVFVPVMDLEINATVALGPVNRKLNDSASGLGDIALIPIAL